jgi:rod shape-determining protein MreD
MNLYFVVPFLALVAILQTALVPALGVGGVRFELMLLMVIAWSVRRGAVEGAVWGFCGGLALDLFSGVPMGTSALALIVVAMLTGLAQGTVVRSRAALPWVMAAPATFIYHGVILIVLAITGRPVDVGVALLRQALPTAVYNVIVMIAVYSFLSWLDRRTGEPELRW